MLSIEKARKKGINACIDLLGREFCLEHEDNSLSGYGEPDNGLMRCFVSVDDEPSIETEQHYVGGEPMPYRAFVDVDMETGEILVVDIITPQSA